MFSVKKKEKKIKIFVLKMLSAYNIHNGPQCEKTCLWGFANNKGTDQAGLNHTL